MNREEVKQEIDRIINEQLDAGNETINIAGLILDFLDDIGYQVLPDDPLEMNGM